MNDKLKRFLIVLILISLGIALYFLSFQLHTFDNFYYYSRWIVLQILLTVLFLLLILLEHVVFQGDTFLLLFLVVCIVWLSGALLGLIWYIVAACLAFNQLEWWIHALLIGFYVMSMVVLFFIVKNVWSIS